MATRLPEATTLVRALDRAFQHAMDAANDAEDIARYCTPNYVEMEAAHCWIELGHPAEAYSTLRQGLAEWHPSFRRDLGLCLARFAVVQAGTDQPDETITVAEHSIAIAAETRSARTKHQLHRASGVLARAGAHEHAEHLRHILRTALR